MKEAVATREVIQFLAGERTRLQSETSRIGNELQQEHQNRDQRQKELIEVISKVRKPAFCICKNKDADQPCSKCSADHAFVFATRIVQSLFFLNPKFQVSSHFL